VGGDDVLANGGKRFSVELQRLAIELGLEDNVQILGERFDIARLLAASDVFALPSYGEPFGLVYLEAMAMKRPVAALNSGGTPEVVIDGETGLLSEYGNNDELAKNLLTLLQDPEMRARMGERGRERVEQNFTSERMARDAERLYENLLNRA
jgi:glycosyltransferase involved in cell wall biosynthesis